MRSANDTPLDPIAEMLAKLPADLDEAALPIIDKFATDWRSDQRLQLTRRDCETLGNWGKTTQRQLEASGALRAFRLGPNVAIERDSFYEFMIGRVVASFSGKAADARSRSPTYFRKTTKPKRIRTPAELAALKRGNEKRRLDAIARREAAAANKKMADHEDRPNSTMSDPPDNRSVPRGQGHSSLEDHADVHEQ
jgi:hypothetical protein